MTLATVEHRYSCAGAVRLFEVQDIVFTPQVRYEPRPGTRAERPAEWHRVLAPSQVLLFRFSALTFNAHRIHYDHPYATAVEGYPGLLVHGPLTCILLLSHLAERFPERALASFTYRARRPAFEGRRITLCGASSGADGAELWAEDEDGFAVMTADARFRKIGP